MRGTRDLMDQGTRLGRMKQKAVVLGGSMAGGGRGHDGGFGAMQPIRRRPRQRSKRGFQGFTLSPARFAWSAERLSIVRIPARPHMPALWR